MRLAQVGAKSVATWEAGPSRTLRDVRTQWLISAQARGFDATAWIISALSQIVSDMVPFIIVLLIVVLCFAFALRVLFAVDAHRGEKTCEISGRGWSNTVRKPKFRGRFGSRRIGALKTTFPRRASRGIQKTKLTG